MLSSRPRSDLMMSWSRNSPCRSGSFEAGLRNTSVSKPSPRLQRSRSTTSKASPSPEKRAVAGGAMQQRVAQLEEELRREREKTRAMRELSEVTKSCEMDVGGAERVQLLEREAERAKESERKMLESLIYQTKLLEQTKISLEEAKLEMASLQQSNRGLEAAAAAATRRRGVEQRSVKDLVFGGADEEIRVLRGELRMAMQGEEKSRKALDDLSVALSDVTMETKQVKIWLSEAQAELETANAEAERLRQELATAEARVRAADDERERCRLDAEESAAAWGDKERVLLECVRASEEEVNRARQENTKLAESQRVIRGENARLRDILKQAVAEANVVKESLELARNENSRLNDVVAEKDSALQSLRQEYECLKVSEAAAQGSLKELNSLLAATTTTTASTTPMSAKTAPMPEHIFEQHQEQPNGFDGESRTMELPSEQWRGEKYRAQNNRRHSLGEPGKFKGGFSQSARMENPKDRVFTSLSNIGDLKSAASAAMDDFNDEFDHIDESHYETPEHATKHKKKRPILRKFGDLFKRKSFNKSNLSSLHS